RTAGDRAESVAGCRERRVDELVLNQRIIYIQYTNPAVYPPLEHSSQIVADQGWQVLFLGTRARGADALRFPPHSNVAVRQLGHCAPGRRQKSHYVSCWLWVAGWIVAWRPRSLHAS